MTESQHADESTRRDVDVGLFIVAGAGFGTLVFAFTENSVWIGVGAALGILLAGVWSMVDRDRRGGSEGEGPPSE